MIVFANRSARASALAAATEAIGGGAPPDLCIVFGGDGTMLRATREHGPAFQYFGVNCGHLGFLMNEIAGTEGEVARRIVDVLATGRYETHAFPRLHMRIVEGGRLAEARALNDVYVERSLGQSCHLRVTVDEVKVVDRMVCDGVVAATPLGSTAYSFSAGGSAAHPLIRAMHLTAICPHTPRLAPIVLPFGSTVRIEALDADRRPARAVSDGVPHDDARIVEVRGGDDEIRLCFLAGHNFTATMIRKILHP